MEVTFQTKRDTRTVAIEPGESILFAGLRAGLELPYECASGTCGTCQALPLDDSEMRDAWPSAVGKQRIPPDSGRVLMCQTHCETSTRLRVFGLLKDRAVDDVNPAYFLAKLNSVDRVNPDIMVFSLKLDRRIDYRAGQFVMLRVGGVKGWRAYSMITAQADDNFLALVIKRLPGGGISSRLFDHAHPGERIEVFGPLGRACLRQNDGDIVAIAGGTGIAGIMSVLESAVHTNYFDTHRARVFFGLRKLIDQFFFNRLSTLIAQSGDKINVTIALSDETETAATVPGFPTLRLAKGLVHDVAEADFNANPPAADTACFLAGPPAMIDIAEQSLITKYSVQSTQIRLDRFGVVAHVSARHP
jgi:toluene monooxygenase electron transfer component